MKLTPYRAARFMTFLHPELDPQGIGYHINQAYLAIGSGGLFGLGYGHSRQKVLVSSGGFRRFGFCSYGRRTRLYRCNIFSNRFKRVGSPMFQNREKRARPVWIFSRGRRRRLDRHPVDFKHRINARSSPNHRCYTAVYQLQEAPLSSRSVWDVAWWFQFRVNLNNMDIKEKFVLFAGGGTMGPVTPLLAVWRAMKRRRNDLSLAWAGTPDGPEREIIKSEGGRFFSVPVVKNTAISEHAMDHMAVRIFKCLACRVSYTCKNKTAHDRICRRIYCNTDYQKGVEEKNSVRDSST